MFVQLAIFYQIIKLYVNKQLEECYKHQDPQKQQQLNFQQIQGL